MALLLAMHQFIRTNLASYIIHLAVSNIKINKEYTVLLDKLSEYAGAGTLQRVCCQAAKKHKLRVKLIV